MNPNQDKVPLVEVGHADFELEVLRSKQPVLVAFCAPWSRPCLVVDAALNEVATACAGELRVVKVNADDNPDLSLWYDVQSIPTLLYFEGGGLRARLVGTASKEAILAKLRAASREPADGGDPKPVPPTSGNKREPHAL
jgi:thioredoxin-like negative regulator of GroEL